MKKYIFVLCFILFFFSFTNVYADSPQTIWQYQCIDTMKSSRDNAAAWKTDPNAQIYINKEVDKISGIGANCVAIDTPYDKEFIPLLTQWVNAARSRNLHVWFRGNFSGFEGWFGFPKNITPQQHTKFVQDFIHNNQDLFADGDIFTPAPEAENSGLFSFSNPETYRQFLIDEQKASHTAFLDIGKNVTVSWASLSGGWAKQVLDDKTIKNLDSIATLDHYVSSPNDMTSYITYFNKKYGANVVIGEFGAPIPDINGDMNEDEQAAFVDKLLFVLYQKHVIIPAVNYWDLYGGSTALLNPDFSNRKVVGVIKKYYQPMQIQGTVVDINGDSVQNLSVATQDGISKASTDASGDFTLVVPVQNTAVKIATSDYIAPNQSVIATHGNTFVTFIVKPVHPTFLFRFKHALKNLF